jgi:hypothetical protein
MSSLVPPFTARLPAIALLRLLFVLCIFILGLPAAFPRGIGLSDNHSV